MKYLSNVVILELAQDRCTGCGRCIEVCPRGVFEMEERRAVIVDKDLCIECGGCANNCEFDVIAVRSGVGCATAVMQSLVKGGEVECNCSDSRKGVRP